MRREVKALGLGIHRVAPRSRIVDFDGDCEVSTHQHIAARNGLPCDEGCLVVISVVLCILVGAAERWRHHQRCQEESAEKQPTGVRPHHDVCQSPL